MDLVVAGIVATIDDVRTIVLDLPGVTEKTLGHRGGTGWHTTGGLVVWERGPSQTDLKTLAEAGLPWPDGLIVAIHTDGLDTKAALIEPYPGVFFTIAHFDGYAAVLTRLDAIDRMLLAEVITDAWLDRAPKRTSRQWLADHHADRDRVTGL